MEAAGEVAGRGAELSDNGMGLDPQGRLGLPALGLCREP